MQREDFNVLEGSGCEYFTLDEAKNLHFAFEMDDEIEMLKRNIFPEKYLETAIGFVVEYFSGKEAKKPMILHCMGVGFSLLQKQYNVDIVIAGFLHDIVEDTNISQELIEKHFGKYTLELILANTKDSLIEKEHRNTELLKRCADHSEDALRVKMMDIKNNFEYYVVKNQIQEIKRCQYLSELLLQYKKDEYLDEIFQEARKILSHQI